MATTKLTAAQIGVLNAIQRRGMTVGCSWSAVCSLMRRGLIVEQPRWSITDAGRAALAQG